MFEHSHVVHAVAFVGEGGTLAAPGKEGTIKFWDLTTGKEQASWKGETTWTFAFSPDGNVMVTAFADEGMDDGKVRF